MRPFCASRATGRALGARLIQFFGLLWRFSSIRGPLLYNVHWLYIARPKSVHFACREFVNRLQAPQNPRRKAKFTQSPRFVGRGGRMVLNLSVSRSSSSTGVECLNAPIECQAGASVLREAENALVEVQHIADGGPASFVSPATRRGSRARQRCRCSLWLGRTQRRGACLHFVCTLQGRRRRPAAGPDGSMRLAAALGGDRLGRRGPRAG